VNKPMKKKIFVSILFLLSFVLIYSVILENIVWIDSRSLAEGIPIQERNTSWGNHNVLFLITLTIASFFSSLVAGTVIKKQFFTFSLLCVTAIAVSIFMIEKDFILTYKFTSLLSFLSSSLASFVGLQLGSHIEESLSSEDRDVVLGIRFIHWIWILFPLSFAPAYLWGVNFVHTVFKFSSLLWTSEEILERIATMICVIPIIAWILIPAGVYSVLAGRAFSDKGPLSQSAVVVAIMVIGGAAAMAIQVSCYYVIEQYFL